MDNGCLIWFITELDAKRLWETAQAVRIGEPGAGEGNGAEGRTRTGDLLITNQLLYQLSYFGLLIRL